MTRPVLSIGMIFKNEIRCIERCLQSLAPLRAALPCELVMADTGATDGSREIAEQYADILFDFAWVDDFSAARNAVLDRCGGEWCLTIDCDEWLENIEPFLHFFHTAARDAGTEAASIAQRNYTVHDNPRIFVDIPVPRLFRRLDGRMRYELPIHEVPMVRQKNGSRSPNAIYASKLILYHDGYIDFDGSHAEKRRRNMELLERELEKKPNDLRTLREAVESARTDAERLYYAKRSVETARLTHDAPEASQMELYRMAVKAADILAQYELECEWGAEALARFPDSLPIQIDCNAFMANALAHMEKCMPALEYGEVWRRKLLAFDKEIQKDSIGLSFVQIDTGNECNRAQIGAVMLRSACEGQQWDQAQVWADFTASYTPDPTTFSALMYDLLRSARHISASGPLWALWQRCQALLASPRPEEQQTGSGSRDVMLRHMAALFPAEPKDKDLTRLAAARQAVAGMGECVPARSARILLSEDRSFIRDELAQVDCWEEILPPVYAHLIRLGICLPEPFFAQPSEALAAAAMAAAQGQPHFADLIPAYAAAEGDGNFLIRILWLSDLAGAAMQKADWSTPEQGLALVRCFAAFEKDLLGRLYRLEAIEECDLPVLPSVHRFGWRLLHALAALQEGDTREYMRFVKSAADDVTGMKQAALFLLDHVGQLRPAPPPNPELMELAKQVRTILSRYAPDDPAVLELKASPLYRQVACWIENDAQQ